MLTHCSVGSETPGGACWSGVTRSCGISPWKPTFFQKLVLDIEAVRAAFGVPWWRVLTYTALCK